jgi:hypothetical protein
MAVPGKSGEVPNWRKVFGFPIVIGLLSLAGLVSALLFEEFGRYFSWIAVGSPIILLSWLVVQRCRRAS